MTWTRHNGGRGWRVLADGRIAVEHGVEGLGDLAPYVYDAGDGALRTKGEPLTMRTLFAEHGQAVEQAADYFHLASSWVAGMVSIEAARMPGSRSFNVFSLRDEDGRDLAGYRRRPSRVSAGLMQTLMSTARYVASHYDLRLEFDGEPQKLDLGDLCVPARSLMLGAAYMRYQADEACGEDPVKLVAAYNAGGIYETDRNPWNLRTYGRNRIPKFIAYHNDALESGFSGQGQQ